MKNIKVRSKLLMILVAFAPTIAFGQSSACITDHIRSQHVPYLLLKGDTLGALKTLDSVAQAGHADHWTLLEATNAALAFGDTTRAIEYMEIIHSAGGQPLLTYSDPIKGLLATGVSEPHLGRLRNAKDQWAAQADSTWIRALIEMKELDQSHREFDALTRHNDSLNLERLIQLTDDRGFPSADKVGSSYGIVTLLLLHHRGERGMNGRLKYFLDQVRPAMDACLVEPSFLSWIIDFEAQEKGEATPYGTLIGYYRNDLGRIHLPDLATLNANRASVGLRPVQEFAEILAIPFEDLPIGR